MSFNNGKLWNINCLLDSAGHSLYSGTLYNGNGYILQYFPIIDSNYLSGTSYATCRLYFNDGYYSGTRECYDCEGNLFLVEKRAAPVSDLFFNGIANISKNSYERTDTFFYQIYLIQPLSDTSYYLFKHKIVHFYLLPSSTGDRMYTLGPECIFVLGEYGSESDYLFLERNRRKLINMKKRNEIKYINYIYKHLFYNCYSGSFEALDHMPLR